MMTATVFEHRNVKYIITCDGHHFIVSQWRWGTREGTPVNGGEIETPEFVRYGKPRMYPVADWREIVLNEHGYWKREALPELVRQIPPLQVEGQAVGTCPVCGRMFVKNVAHHRYCNFDCKYEAQKKRTLARYHAGKSLKTEVE